MPVISSHLGSVWREESLMIYSRHTCTPHWRFSFDGLMTVGFAKPVGVTDAQICIVHTCHCMNPFHTILMIVWKEIQGILSPVLICLNEHGWSWQCLNHGCHFCLSNTWACFYIRHLKKQIGGLRLSPWQHIWIFKRFGNGMVGVWDWEMRPLYFISFTYFIHFGHLR